MHSHQRHIGFIFLDNTDPEGMDRVLAEVNLSASVIAVLSKSGGTKETRNAMLEARHFYEQKVLTLKSERLL